MDLNYGPSIELFKLKISFNFKFRFKRRIQERCAPLCRVARGGVAGRDGTQEGGTMCWS